MNRPRVIERIYNTHLRKSLNSPMITVLIGPRQSGKTTSVNSFLDGIIHSRRFYLNLDSSFERDRIKSNESYLEEKIEETLGFRLNSLKERFYVFIDEAQKLPLIFETIKILYDRYSGYLKFIISGSSSLELLDKTAETLAGRVQVLRIYPFSMSEASVYEEIGGFECAETFYKGVFSGSLNQGRLSRLIREFKPKGKKKIQLINKLITRSLFPPTFSKVDEYAIPRWLIDYIDTYIERDMRSIKDIGNIEGYRRVVAQLSSRVGSLLDYNQLGNDAGVNQITTKKYVTIWQESLIGFLLSPFFLNISTRIKKSKKVYFFDNALIWALSGFKDINLIEASGGAGHYFENLVIADFIKWGINLEMPPSFYFWQKSPVSEIDLVISTKGMAIPVEIKYSTAWDKKYMHAIDIFKEKHGGKGLKVPFSLVVYRGDFFVPRKDVFCIPVWVLC
ncbi:MAG: ATP-binding protein [Nitrospirae bacterium]|nr:ATP-binding protein [Nitrospirota bacterium]